MVHRAKAGSRVIFGPDAILSRPHLAAHIAAIAAAWTIIEETWGHILGEALDAEAKTGVAMYLALSGATSQGAVLTEAVKMHLPEQIQRMVAEARQAEKGVARDRNRVVHGRWGILLDDERYLVLGESNWLPRALAHIRDQHGKVRNALREVESYPDMEMMLYSENDFVQISKRLKAHSDRLSGIIFEAGTWRQERRLLARSAGSPNALARGLLSPRQTAPRNLRDKRRPVTQVEF